MTLLLLIRHGLNDFVGKRLAGRLDGVHLNRKGRAQATRLTQILAEVPIKAIYTSPLERAVETAQPLAQAHNLSLRVQPGLIEIDYGRLQGRSGAQLKRLAIWKTVQQTPSAVRFPEGESFQEAQQRAVTALEEIHAAWEENDVVACFSHCDIVRLALTYYLQMPLDAFQRLTIDPGSISLVQRWKGSVRVLGVNHATLLGVSVLQPPRQKKKASLRRQHTTELPSNNYPL